MRLVEGERATVDGEVTRVRFESDDGDFQVLVVSLSQRTQVTAVVRGAALMLGEHVQLEGAVRRHRSGELQLDAERVERVLPKTAAGVEAYLASNVIGGIGPKLAAQIVARFGDRTLDVLDEEPERLREVPGVGAKRVAAIQEAWSHQKGVREVMIFLQSRGISPAFSARIFKEYGGRAVRVVQENPYRLALEIHGIGFRTADRIARMSGFAVDDPRRVAAGVEFALEQALADGHVMLPRQELVDSAAALLEVSEAAVEDRIAVLVSGGRVVEDEARVGAPGYYLHHVFAEEAALAEHILGLSASLPRVRCPEPSELARVELTLPFTLAPGQRAALRSVLGSPLSVLTGGPGTGKTTIVQAAVLWARDQGLTVELAAPTGRAARRLTEATGVEARTLHRLLAYDPRRGEFARDEDDPLATDLVIVDEASMLDQPLALALLRAVRHGTALLLVGDVEQLPSVGAGDVLADIIASAEVPVARLDQVFRQAGASQIVECAHAIRAGELPEPSPGADGEFFFIEVSDPERAVQTVVRAITERMPAAFGLSPLTDIQCLAPMHAGAVGTQALNAALQSALGVGGPALTKGSRSLHVGDKVMQVRNNYDLDVFNGDIGVVASIDVERVAATVEYDGRPVVYEREALDDLVLAYAISVHKSQGSEFRGVVLVLMTHHYRLLQRNLVYTAVTRAKERLVIVGTKRALRMAIDGVSAVRRHTRLVDRLTSRSAPC